MQFTGKPTSAMPNSGHPALVDGRNLCLCSPEYMAQHARRTLWDGVPPAKTVRPANTSHGIECYANGCCSRLSLSVRRN